MSPPTPDGNGPVVVACLRVTDLRRRVDPLSGAVSGDPWGIDLAPADAAALEHALRIAEAWDAGVIAVAAGPPAVEPVLRSARALGAHALRVAHDEPDGDDAASELAADEHRLARRLAAALEPFGRPSLVLCGDRSADRGTGALPAFLAHELGAAQALGLVRLELPSDDAAPGDHRGAVLAERRLDGGWRERLAVPLPAVCSVEPAGVTLRRATLAGALDAEKEPVPVVSPSVPEVAGGGRREVSPTRPFRPRTRLLAAPEGADPRTRVLALTGALVERDPPTVIGPVDAEAAADAFLSFLVRHGYLEPSVPAGEARR